MTRLFKNKPIKQDLHHKTSLQGTIYVHVSQIGLFFSDIQLCF